MGGGSGAVGEGILGDELVLDRLDPGLSHPVDASDPHVVFAE
jgi:hypothetical protein